MAPFFVQIKCQLGKAYEVASRIADAEIACPIGYFDDDAGELASDDERWRHADLIPIGDEKDIGIVHRRCGDPQPHLSRFESLRPLFGDTDHLRWPVFRADRGAGHL